MAYDPTKHEALGTNELDATSGLPLINLLQQLSPQLNANKEKYIENSKVGDLFFAPTSEILPQPIKFIPTAFRTLYVEWVPKSDGGGIAGMHPLSIVTHPSYEKDRVRQYDEWLGNNELKKTTYILGLMELNGEYVESMIALSSTGQKVSRLLQKSIRAFRYTGEYEKVVPSVFAQSWELSSVYNENKSGEGYYSMKFSNPTALDFDTDEDLLNLCGDTAEKADLTLPSSTPAKTLAVVDDADVPY